MIEELAAGEVIAHDADGEDTRAEIGEVVNGVSCAAGIRFGAAMAEDKDRGFAGDARNFTGDEFVEHEIADDADGLAGEGGDDVEQAREVHAGVGFMGGAGR